MRRVQCVVAAGLALAGLTLPTSASAAADAAKAPAAAAGGEAELAALRDEVRELRAELKQAVGEPAPNPERARLEAELQLERKNLAALEAAVEAGLERSSVEAALSRVQARIAELELALEALPAREAKPPRSLYEVSGALDRAEQPPASPPAKPEPEPRKDSASAAGGALESAKIGLLPLEFTAFGDFFYRFARPSVDDFHVGAVELDASLALTPFVNVSTAIAYAGEDDSFGIGAFVIDCGIAGDGDGFPLQTKHVVKSGVSFGRFDVPFGVAYLEYPSVENRLITLPQAVLATHGAWNDTGAQFYAVGEHWTAVGYVVNGIEHPLSAEAVAPARTAAGGRASGKVDELFELGASAAWDFAAAGAVMFIGGADLSATLGPLDVRSEYLLRQVKAPGVPELTHGAYGRALFHLDPAFLIGRYDTVLDGSDTLDRRLSGGAGVELFAQGELRAVYEQSLNSDIRSVTLQLVGGSSFQPTGLRR